MSLELSLLAAYEKGRFCLKENELSFPADALNSLIPFTSSQAIKRGGAYFLPKIASFLDSLNVSLPSLVEKVEDPCPSFGETSLTASQQTAIKKGYGRRLSLIIGGPGTGKTYTAGVLLSLLGKEGMSIGCAAPTGKAAERLKESLQKASKGAFKLESRTLHSLLGIGLDPQEVPPLLPYDLLVVDEASMIDPHLFTLLLSKIPPKGRLFLLGDPDQLPPVDGGGLFAPLAELYLQKGWTMRLEVSHRTENPRLLSFAEAIRKGDLERVEKLLPNFLATSKEPPDNVRILSPLREGPMGVEEINRKMFLKALKRGDLSYPIILTKNAKSEGLWNGELGRIYFPEGALPSSYNSLRTHSESKAMIGGKERVATTLPAFELAYALTIHKAQGSEEERLSLLLPEKASLSRALLYTAVTRAKRELFLFGSKELILEAIKETPLQHPIELLFPSI